MHATFFDPRNTAGLPQKEINMSTSFRVSLVMAVLLGLSQVGFAGVMTQTREPAANALTTKSPSSLKSKKKKKKTVAPSVVILGAYAQPTVSAPAAPPPVAS